MKLIFCDLDGTLEDSRQDMARSAQMARAQLDLEAGARADWVPFVNKGMEHLYRQCFKELFENAPAGSESELETLEKIRDVYEPIYLEEIVHSTRLYDGVKEALVELSELATLSLYTNKPQQHSRKLLLELGVSRYFSFIVGCDTFAETKPAVGPMNTIAADVNFDAAKDQSFMIGDTAGDMKAARNFGATAIWCAWGYNADAPGDPAPDFQAAHPSELPQIIRSAG